MKKIFQIILVSLLVINVHAEEKMDATSSVLEVAFFDFPGLTSVDTTGKPIGFVNDITIKVLERLGVKYNIKMYPAARFYEYLSSGKVQLFNGLSSIPAVQQSTVSSKLELFPLVMRVYWVGQKPKIEKKEDLVGKSVILVRGFSYKDWGAWIRDPNNKVTFHDTNTHESAFEMLKNGRADYLLNYKYIDANVLKNVAIPDLNIKTLFQWSCAFNVYKGYPHATEFVKKLDDTYKQLVKEGLIDKFD